MKAKIAVIQAAPVLFRLEETLAKMERLVRKAGGNGASLVLFPESFVPGYPRGISFGTVVGSRSEPGRRQWLEYWNSAVSIPGEAAGFMGDLARRFKVFLVAGVTERDKTGYTLYCSVLYFAPDGQLLGRHRKLKPTGSERTIWGEGRGDDLQVWSSEAGRTGGLICWENYMPLARQALYRQGIELYLAPTADARDSWQATLQHIACEGRCFVAAANQYVTRNMYPAGQREELPAEPRVLCRGGSAILDPYGRYLAGPLYDREDILYAILDHDELLKSKMDFDVTGHYSRHDVFEYRWKKEKSEQDFR